MYHIHSIKIILFLALSLGFLGVQEVEGQWIAKDNFNYLDFQRKPYYFGITFGLHNTGYRVNQSRAFINNDSIRIAEGAPEIGIDLHLIGNLKIGEYFDFRVLPGFSFSNRSFEFTHVSASDGQVSRETLESVFFEVPFHLRFKSQPYKDKRAFVVGGIKYTYDLSSNSQSRLKTDLIRISPHDFQYEIGVGMQFFFPYFIFSPEIKYSRGLGNILLYNNDLNEARVLEQVVSEIITISFHFEG